MAPSKENGKNNEAAASIIGVVTPMSRLLLNLPGQTPRMLGPEPVSWRIGRSAQNEVVIEDPSLSRHHARLEFQNGKALIEDLGSLNGTMINGERIQGVRALKPGDQLVLGTVLLTLGEEPTSTTMMSSVHIEKAPKEELSSGTMVFRAAELRSGSYGTVQPENQAKRWLDALAMVSDLTLELVQDVATEILLDHLMERLFLFFEPDRSVVMLKDSAGDLVPVVVRTNEFLQGKAIKLSQTLVDAAMERREALLVNNAFDDPMTSAAASIVRSGMATIMVTPLEHEGQVIGLIYMDAKAYREPFTEDDLRLVTALAHIAAAKIRTARLVEEVQKKKAMDQELAMARQIQQKLLPEKDPIVSGWELYGSNEASRQVSGDLYGYWTRPDGKMYVAIADVSGKGMGPGLMMAAFTAYMNAWAETMLPPSELATRISGALGLHTAKNRFITAIFLLLDPASDTIQFTNAGHNPGLLLRANGKDEELGSHGMPLAMLVGTPYGQDERTLAVGDVLALYTDGITEAQNPAGIDFEMVGIQNAVATHRGKPLPLVGEEIHRALDRHTRGAPLADDRTLVLVRRR